MRVGAGLLVVVCGLSLGDGCGGGPGEQDDSGSGGSGNDSGSGSSLSGGQSGGSQSGGTGGSASEGGATSDGAGGTGGAGTGGAGGAPAWPDWVSDCVSFRAQLCSLCAYPECVMCVYGTDEEIAETGVVCNDTEENYRMYCNDCAASCPPCRDEWRG